jgi:hypothetical protein
LHAVSFCVDLELSAVGSIKREIGHLCHDERRPKPAKEQTSASPTAPASSPTQAVAPPVVAAAVSPAAMSTVGLAGTYAPGTSWFSKHSDFGIEFDFHSHHIPKCPNIGISVANDSWYSAANLPIPTGNIWKRILGFEVLVPVLDRRNL